LLAVAAVALLSLRAVSAVGQEAAGGRDAAVLPAGQVVVSVVCAHDSSQSYALYLPSNYTSARRWPVLYAFDPGGRGQLPVKLFSEAAERLGYVVVGSNNSRNGPWEPATEAMQAMWRDTHARFALDPHRIYTTGMSGGAAPAALLAAASGAGVIACGSALTAEQLPETGADHAWFIVAGRSDFNYTVNRKLAEALAGRGASARFAEFDGGHNWPPADVAGRALEFIQLSAIRTGRAPRDDAFVEHYALAGVARAGELAAQGMADGAADEWAALARELAGLMPVAHYEAEAHRLNATGEARENRKREARVRAKFDSEVRVLLTLRHVLERGTPEFLLWPTFRSAFPSGDRAPARRSSSMRHGSHRPWHGKRWPPKPRAPCACTTRASCIQSRPRSDSLTRPARKARASSNTPPPGRPLSHARTPPWCWQAPASSRAAWSWRPAHRDRYSISWIVTSAPRGDTSW
jgi:dienelactone hydrolase